MDDVLRLEDEVHRLAERNVQLVRGAEGVDSSGRGWRLVLRIAELPPQLEAHDFVLQAVLTRLCLRLEDETDGRNSNHDQDEKRNDGPRDLQRGVAVYVFRLGLIGPLAELPERPNQDEFHEDEDNRSGNDQQP